MGLFPSLTPLCWALSRRGHVTLKKEPNHAGAGLPKAGEAMGGARGGCVRQGGWVHGKSEGEWQVATGPVGQRRWGLSPAGFPMAGEAWGRRPGGGGMEARCLKGG